MDAGLVLSPASKCLLISFGVLSESERIMDVGSVLSPTSKCLLILLGVFSDLGKFNGMDSLLSIDSSQRCLKKLANAVCFTTVAGSKHQVLLINSVDVRTLPVATLANTTSHRWRAKYFVSRDCLSTLRSSCKIPSITFSPSGESRASKFLRKSGENC